MKSGLNSCKSGPISYLQFAFITKQFFVIFLVSIQILLSSSYLRFFMVDEQIKQFQYIYIFGL